MNGPRGFVGRVLDRTGTREIARALRDRARPHEAEVRAFRRWLEEADRLDNGRMRVAMAAALAPDANCVDVGAFTGDFLADAYTIAPRGTHIAYEPLAGPFATLQERFPAADLRRAAVGDTVGTVAFSHVRNAPGWSGFLPYEVQVVEHADVEQVEVPVVRLDDDLPAGYRPHLIKVDVNGAEERFLRGAMDTLRRHRPLLLLEHGHAAAAYGTTAADIHRLLTTEAGLRVFDLEGNGPLDRVAFEAAATTKWNFLARA